MSRTDKDRPYWVRVNDPSEPTISYHDHLSFGKISTWRWGGGCPLEYADYCTIDEPKADYRRSKEEMRKPCSKELGYQYKYWDNPRKAERRNEYWKPLRATERKVLWEAVKDYNSFGEVDDELYVRENTRNAPFNRGWWH